MRWKLFSLTFWVAVVILFTNCSKSEEQINRTTTTPYIPGVNLTNLQQKWFMHDIWVFENINFVGASYQGMGFVAGEYFNFRGDGKLITYAMRRYDSADYILRTADSSMLISQYYGGVPQPKPDTVFIRKMTKDSLVFAKRNGPEWGRFRFWK